MLAKSLFRIATARSVQRVVGYYCQPSRFFGERPRLTKVLSRDEEMDLVKRLPYVPMKEGWKVQLHPNFAGSFLRMNVILPDGRRKSVYLDVENNLGSYPYGTDDEEGKPNPYWEVLPATDDEHPDWGTGRCNMEDMDKLIRLIES